MSFPPEPATVCLRRATVEDAEALTALGRETFTAAFGPRYPARDLEAFLTEAHTPHLYRVWIGDPSFAIWVAERDGALLAYALAGPCHLPHPEVTRDCGELWRLYLRPEAQGLGLGGRLLDTALDWLARPGRALWLGVWSENHRAQKLYASRGFAKVGDYEFPVGEIRDQEFIFRRDARATSVPNQI